MVRESHEVPILTRMRRHIILAAALAAAFAPAAAVYANTSHKGWPKIDGDLKMHKADQSGPIRATELARHNELLGGHGNDSIYAGNAGDVLWGDYKPSGQPTTQVDHLYGGAGRDFIYASHGTNFIYSGGGRDVIHAHFGRGAIHCSPQTIVYISHRSRPRYHLDGCTRVSYKPADG
jgi:RTX calcium-binding nonapeptide repeat (4 copies)